MGWVFFFLSFFFFRLFHGRCHFGTKKVGPVTEHYTGIVVGSPQYTDADRQSERGRCDVVNPRSIRFNLCTRRCDTFRAFVSSEYSADVRFPIAYWLQQLAQRTHLRLVNPWNWETCRFYAESSETNEIILCPVSMYNGGRNYKIISRFRVFNTKTIKHAHINKRFFFFYNCLKNTCILVKINIDFCLERNTIVWIYLF